MIPIPRLLALQEMRCHCRLALPAFLGSHSLIITLVIAACLACIPWLSFLTLSSLTLFLNSPLAPPQLGLALALELATIQVEEIVWEGAARTPRYAMLRSQLRLCIPETEEREGSEEESQEDADRTKLARAMAEAERRPPPRPPWEYASAEEVLEAPLEDKALSALVAGLRLPSAESVSAAGGGAVAPGSRGGADAAAAAAEDAADAMLTALLEPLLDDTVRRELRARRALAQGEPPRAFAESSVFSPADPELFALNTAIETCARLRREVAVAVTEEDYASAAKLQVRERPFLPFHAASSPPTHLTTSNLLSLPGHPSSSRAATSAPPHHPAPSRAAGSPACRSRLPRRAARGDAAVASLHNQRFRGCSGGGGGSGGSGT